MLDHRLARLEELVLGGEELVVDAVGVALLAPPLVRSDLPALRQALVSLKNTIIRREANLYRLHLFASVSASKTKKVVHNNL